MGKEEVDLSREAKPIHMTELGEREKRHAGQDGARASGGWR